MSVRTVCIQLPLAPPPLSLTVPGAGTIQGIRSFTLQGYDVCADARGFLLSVQPILGALGMPLCVLNCLTSVIKVFSSNFPYINPAALARIPIDCSCLTTFTPFSFCAMLRGIVNGVNAVIQCVFGLLGDILRVESQISALMADPETQFMGKCLGQQANAMLNNLTQSMKPVMAIMNMSGFLFSFVGVPFSGIADLSGSSTAEVLQNLSAIQQTLFQLTATINATCPG